MCGCIVSGGDRGEPGIVGGGRGVEGRRREDRKQDFQGGGIQEKLRKSLQHFMIIILQSK